MANLTDRDRAPRAPGLVLHRARAYDIAVRLMSLGREGAFREKLVRLARLQPGEAVLDIGCGTGTLAIAAKRAVGAGTVQGIDASPEMLARARDKARKADADIVFTEAPAQDLPFPDAQFDVVLTTVMLHHLSRSARERCLAEARRVLKPGGRVLAVDFAVSGKQGLLSHIHRRHGHVSLDDIVAMLGAAGFTVVASGPVGFRSLQFALAAIPPAP